MEFTISHIENKIFTVRGMQVMLDSDLALLYGTETKFINRAVKRNPLRFPDSFFFQLTEKEWIDLKYHFGTSSELGGRKKNIPNVFILQKGAILFSNLFPIAK